MNLQHLKSLHAKATQGEWMFKKSLESWQDASYNVVVKDTDRYYDGLFMSDEPYYPSAPDKHDANFIVALVNSFPDIVKELEAGEAK